MRSLPASLLVPLIRSTKVTVGKMSRGTNVGSTNIGSCNVVPQFIRNLRINWHKPVKGLYDLRNKSFTRFVLELKNIWDYLKSFWLGLNTVTCNQFLKCYYVCTFSLHID